MSESKPRRRWMWLVLLAALLAGVVLAWRFRPLTTDERALVGTWRREMRDPSTQQISLYDLTLMANRRWMSRMQTGGQPWRELANGEWSAKPGELCIVTNLPVQITWKTFLGSIPNLFRKPQQREVVALVFDGPDTISLMSAVENMMTVWKRTPGEAIPEPTSLAVP